MLLWGWGRSLPLSQDSITNSVRRAATLPTPGVRTTFAPPVSPTHLRAAARLRPRRTRPLPGGSRDGRRKGRRGFWKGVVLDVDCGILARFAALRRAVPTVVSHRGAASSSRQHTAVLQRAG